MSLESGSYEPIPPLQKNVATGIQSTLDFDVTYFVIVQFIKLLTRQIYSTVNYNKNQIKVQITSSHLKTILHRFYKRYILHLKEQCHEGNIWK